MTASNLLKRSTRTLALLLAVGTCAGFSPLSARSADEPIILKVDAREVSRRILHATLRVPARAGPLTLVYPKWIPGEHGPTGPIADMTGLKMSAGGKPIAWRRDAEDNYAIHVEVPQGAQAVDVSLDFLLASDANGFSSAASSSENIGAISWNTLLLYPKGTAANAVTFAAQLQLPEGWQFATALTRAGGSDSDIEFAPVTLETLIDSPVVAGKYVRTFDLSPGSTAPEHLNVIADSIADLEMKTNNLASFGKLVVEANALFGAHHYRHYDFLLTLSEEVAHFGLEHHESSDDRASERMLVDEDVFKRWAALLPHEMVHSWNGKYRRPAGLATPDYQQPMKTELLWVYEGLTEYLGQVLTARSGLWSSTNYMENLAIEAAMLDLERGRDWRPLVDTADAAHLLYGSRGEGAAWRRGVDFYPEGDLIWLEADVKIRQLTNGKRSLDDFCQRFFGGENTPPRVVPYTLEDVIAALNAVTPSDWQGFFQQRVYEVNPRAPMGGIEGGGWRLVYRDTESDLLKAEESGRKSTNLACSLGLALGEDGWIRDVVPGSPADRGGVSAGMKLLAVNSRHWTPELIRTAIKLAKGSNLPIQLLVENGDIYKTCLVDYHGGERYPDLERDTTKPDLLSEIIKPRVK